MKWLKAIFACIFYKLFLSLYENTGFFYHTGAAISFGLYCQFENVLYLSDFSYQVLTLPSLTRAVSLLTVFSNSAVQTLEILFLFSSLLLILYHTIKVFDNPPPKAC